MMKIKNTISDQASVNRVLNRLLKTWRGQLEDRREPGSVSDDGQFSCRTLRGGQQDVECMCMCLVHQGQEVGDPAMPGRKGWIMNDWGTGTTPESICLAILMDIYVI